MRFSFFILILLCSFSMYSQSLVDSSKVYRKLHMYNVYIQYLKLSESEILRFKIDDKNHNIVTEQPNGYWRAEYFLDSICNEEIYPSNCYISDSLKNKFPNKSKIDWGKSIKIHSYLDKKKKIERKDLVKKWFSNLDSIVFCKEVDINEDSKLDMILLKKDLETRLERDTINGNYREVKTGSTIYRMYEIINRGDNYVIVHKSFDFDLKTLKFFYLSSFKIRNAYRYLIIDNDNLNSASLLKMYNFYIDK